MSNQSGDNLLHSMLCTFNKRRMSAKAFHDADLARLCCSIITGDRSVVAKHINRHKICDESEESVAIAVVVEAAKRYCDMMLVRGNEEAHLSKQFPQLDLFDREARHG